MVSAAQDGNTQESDTTEQSANIQAAIARTLTRSMALYFSRPVRLFRPSKISGWQSLRSMAKHQGATFDPKFLLSVVKLQGFGAIQKHFFPPMIVNAMLGTVLWTTYAETYSLVEGTTFSHPIIAASFSGGIAGGAQALVAAPAENVRLLIERGTSGHSWTQAWRELIRNTAAIDSTSQKAQLQDARELRSWLREVGGMTGRGWNGWGWGCAKDICAFSAFFTIFEITRRIGQAAKSRTEDILSYIDSRGTRLSTVQDQLPRTINSIILVTGGVAAGLAYEVICRPWDRARRILFLSNRRTNQSQMFKPIFDAVRAEGPAVLFRNPQLEPPTKTRGIRGKLYGAFRTLGRVGPWGVGFLVWEVYGPGIS